MSEGSGSNKGYKGSQGRPPATEIKVPGGVTAVAVSPDGACIATAGVDGVMRIYSMSGGGPTAGFKVTAAPSIAKTMLHHIICYWHLLRR